MLQQVFHVRSDKMEEDGLGPKHEDGQRYKKNVPASQRVAHSQFEVPKKRVIELWEALIDDTARSYTCLLLGVSETLCLLSLHLFNGLCVRVLNSLFSSGTSETLPSRPCLCLFLRCNRSAPLPGCRAGLSLAGRPTKFFNPDPPLVGSVLRCQYLLQRRERGASFFHL